MTRAAWGQMTDRILLALGEIHTGSLQDVLDEMGVSDERQAATVRKTLNAMAAAPKGQRRVHIAKWCRTQERQRAYPRPVYRIGDGPNASKPAPKDHTTASREYLQRCKTLVEFMHCAPFGQKAARAVLAQIRAKGLAR